MLIQDPTECATCNVVTPVSLLCCSAIICMACPLSTLLIMSHIQTEDGAGKNIRSEGWNTGVSLQLLFLRTNIRIFPIYHDISSQTYMECIKSASSTQGPRKLPIKITHYLENILIIKDVATAEYCI